jgi:hypothetical protein
MQLRPALTQMPGKLLLPPLAAALLPMLSM